MSALLPVVIVSGLGRCGTSLVMQMLSAGGLPCVGLYPGFEDERAGAERVDAAWLARMDGHAVKILDPQRSRPALPAHRYTLFLTRDHCQQAASQVKFCEMLLGIRTGRAGRRKLQSFLGSDEKAARIALKLAISPHREMRFEDIIRHPRQSAQRMAADLSAWWSLDAGAMTACVRRRSTDCLPGLLEAQLVAEARDAFR